MKLINVVGARPNFVKISPIIGALNKHPDMFEHILVHTGQHYDDELSNRFFDVLNIPAPDINLNVGSGSHAEQTGRIMIEFEKVCDMQKPELVIVVGDVNSTLACAITAKKLNIKVAHVEAGLRSRDMSMPEEINRLCTDAIADYLFTTDELACENLLKEGITAEKIHFVGNVMIDSLRNCQSEQESAKVLQKYGLSAREYATLTLHRPANVDNVTVFKEILDALVIISKQIPIVFPAHPRTAKMIEKFGLHDFFQDELQSEGIWLIEPLNYLEFLHLNMSGCMAITDSGGVQEETTVTGVPCITLRENTERSITCTQGTNYLVGHDKRKILDTAQLILSGKAKQGKIPDKWDGKTAERIVEILL